VYIKTPCKPMLGLLAPNISCVWMWKSKRSVSPTRGIITYILLIYLFILSPIFMLRIPFFSRTKPAIKFDTPVERAFLPLQQVEAKLNPMKQGTDASNSYASASKYVQVHNKLRILQFNILADGLSGLRKDLGGFSRVNQHDIVWEKRKNRLLKEMTQYDPDIITLQECDHYYDYFLPTLSSKGYNGIYAPKPASACLEVSENADGCCIFVKRNKIRICSSEVG
jgi:hypothetical protein